MNKVSLQKEDATGNLQFTLEPLILFQLCCFSLLDDTNHQLSKYFHSKQPPAQPEDPGRAQVHLLIIHILAMWHLGLESQLCLSMAM